MNEARRIKLLKSVDRLDAGHVDQLYQRMAAFRCFPDLESCFQYYYVHDRDGKRVVDFVGRFESLSEDFLAILSNIGLDCALPHVNRTERSVVSDYTDSGRARVRELWAQDFQGLGYLDSPKVTDAL